MIPNIRAYDAKLDVIDGERCVVATINTSAVDRYQTVIVPSGGDYTAYRKNPVVLAYHDQKIVIGKNLWIKASKDRILAKTQFLPEGIEPLADKIFKLYQGEFLKAWSIGFDPIEYGRPTPDELRKNKDWADAQTIFRTWELREYSAVTVPGNADALSEACSRGLDLPGWDRAKLFPGNIPAEPTPAPARAAPTDAEILAIARLRLPALARQIVRDARDLARGRV